MVDEKMEQRIKHILDKAIAAVAKREFQRLSHRVNDDEKERQIRYALCSLDELRGSGEPDYKHEWVALLYLTWFQPRQINMIYSFLLHLVKEPLPDRVRVVDLGCGALAMQLAFATFAAITGQLGTTISIHGIDRSRAIRSVGWRLWQKVHELAVTNGLDELDQVMVRMSEKCTSHATLDGCASNDANWVTAVHAVYEGSNLADDLKSAADRVSPKMVIATTEEGKRRIMDAVMARAFDLTGTTRGRVQSYEQHRVGLPNKDRFEGCLQRTTEERKTLRRWAQKSSREYRYLSNPVTWDRKTPIIRGRLAVR